MPFLAPFIPMIAKGGAMLGAGMLGSKLAKSKPTSMERQVLDQNLSQQKETQAQGMNVLGMGRNAIQRPMNYWASILSGDRGLATSAMAPEINRIGEGYRAAATTSAALSPRGGPSTSFLSQLPFQQQRDVSTLMQTARPQAATQVASLGQNLLSQGTNLLQASTAAGRSVLDQQAEQKRLEAERGRSIGTGLFDIIQKYGFPAIDEMLKGRTGGGGRVFNAE